MGEPRHALGQARRRKGMTQAELADGIVSQSMVCQIERGQVEPSADTIRRLAKRLGEDPEAWIAAWERWQGARRDTRTLWNAAQNHNFEALRGGLQRCRTVIPDAERCFYEAFLEAHVGNPRTAEQRLMEAWRSLGAKPVEGIEKLGKSAFRKNPDWDCPWCASSRRDPLATLNRQRAGQCLLLDAWARVRIAERCGRDVAAAVWRRKAEQRASVQL